MKIEEILATIKDLAKSQGSYGRLYSRLMELKIEDERRYNEVCNELEEQNFRDPVDLVLYFET